MPNLWRACLCDAMSVDTGSNPLALLGSGDRSGGTCGTGLVAAGGRMGSRGQAFCVTNFHDWIPWVRRNICLILKGVCRFKYNEKLNSRLIWRFCFVLICGNIFLKRVNHIKSLWRTISCPSAKYCLSKYEHKKVNNLEVYLCDDCWLHIQDRTILLQEQSLEVVWDTPCDTCDKKKKNVFTTRSLTSGLLRI